MTEAMGKQIRDLRLKGLGYQTIATVIGTSRENVRYYCKTHGLMGDAKLVALNYEEHKNHPENCKYCGGKIMRNRYSGKKLFCSDRCRKVWWQEHKDQIKYSDKKTYECTCDYCKKPFRVYGNSNRKYCSHDCYIQDRFWTDHETDVDDKEIKLRQKLSEGKNTGKLVLRKISA